MSTVGRRLLSSVIYGGDVKNYIKMGLAPHLFRDSEVLLFDLINSHLMNYGTIPKPETVEGLSGFENALTSSPEPPAYYLEEVEKRYLHSTLKSKLNESFSLLNDKKAEQALEVISQTVVDLYQKQHRHHLFDFREANDFILDAYVQQKQLPDEAGVKFGWPTLDAMTGGLRGGDFCAIVGRPSSGKTFKLLYMALNAWKNGQVPLFVSMEMNKLIIAQRLASMSSSKKLTNLMKAELSDKAFNSMMEILTEDSHMANPFWVVDGNLTTNTDQVLMLVKQLKPSLVLVDGAYLLRSSDPKSRASRFERITENAEAMKQRIATDMDIPVVASYQFNREVSKKSKKKEEGQKAGLEDIYGSDAIGQLATVVLGLMEEETVETLFQRKVDIMKGRNGETGQFSINWDFNFMDFSQVEESVKEMQFLG